MYKKTVILKNTSNGKRCPDLLHSSVISKPVTCMSSVCLGSVMGTRGRDTGESRSAEEVLQHAKDFLDQYYSSIRRNGSAGHIARWNQIQEEVTKTGSYQLTETELVYGAKLAWRNSSRCIGRIQWSKLQVFDCRYVTSTSGMFDALCNHIKYSTNKGNIRSALTVFPQRTDGNHDFRIWNAQLVGYAGYRQPDGSVFGDPLNVDFTDVCIKLGWKSKGTRFDILPLVLSADGEDPDYFDIPPELIMEIPLSHPIYPWFTDLDLKWYALPAVANMMFDCGGIEFTAAPFNGWYMSSEIACRDLCDSSRYNVLEPIATRMGLDTRAAVTLWRDRALVECNVAVLYSFQLHNVTIVDHHTASESFMKHYENEFRLRGGCPADWVWIVPPLSGSITPVFHQEMALYHLKPSYEYQDQPWRGYTWKKNKDHLNNKTTRKFHFKQVARAVKFTSKLFGQALSRRIKATVLFATETGKSEMFAKKLCDIFRHAFNAKVYCMSEYDFSNIEHEAMLLVVTSTFGNGDPPENGEIFAQHLYSLKMRDDSFRNDDNGDNVALISPKSFIKANSQQDITNKPPQLDRLDSLRGTYNMENTFGPLSNVRFSVFALGSSAYPNFCAFGKFVDNILGELGGERLMPMTTGDEICGQEQAFWKWASEVFNVSCETFCIDDIDTNLEPSYFFNTEPLSKSNVRFVKGKEQQLETSLAKSHNKKVTCCKLLKRINLHEENASRTTFNVQFEIKLPYKPGDHVGICACNNSKIVDGILSRLEGVQDPDEIVQLELLKDINTPQGITQSWEAHDRLPPCSIRTLFTRILDLTTPASPNLLQYFSTIASKLVEKDRLYLLATDSSVYEEWRHRRFPHLLEVLEEFSSVRPHVALLAGQLNILQPRFYSISSSPLVFPDQVHLTVAAVSYRTDDGEGPIHYGVCSNYLQTIPEQSDVYLFVRSAIGFHLPSDHTKPIILVGPGTGIAPFRGFWQHRLSEINSGISDTGKMWLFFGCRGKYLDLYMDEKSEMLEKKVLDRVFLALSREPDIPKTYVQDLLLKEAENVYNLLVKEQGHFYVCGDCTMAEHVYQTLKKIIQQYGNLSDADVEKYVLTLRDENRYHEDIFGITLRTTEVHNRSRVSARIKMIS